MRLRAAIAVLPLIVLVACAPTNQSGQSSGDLPASSDATGSAGASSGAPSSPATLGPQVPADTTVATPVDRKLMPTASGSFGAKPNITVPSTPPPDTLQRVVLTKGDGPEVKANDWLQVNYLGQVWGGKVFDNSYDKGSLFTFQIGSSPQPMVVAGWDYGLRGVTQGSRVLLSFPPQDGYGTTGKAPDISGTDTLVFVVDVVNIVKPDAAGQADAAAQPLTGDLPTVTGDLGKKPTVKVPSGLAAPTAEKLTVLAKGTGTPAAAGDVLVQYVATTWDGSETETSWPDPTGKDATAGTGPRSLPLSSDSPFAGLIGVPMGSRVILVMPADSTNGTPALAWVLDLVLQQDVTPATTASGSAGATDTGGTPPDTGTPASPAPTSSAAPTS